MMKKTKKPFRIDARIEVEDEAALKKIHEITGESKTGIIRRLIQNEFHLLTDKPELIANKLEDITERRFQRLFDKLEELRENQDNTERKMNDSIAISRQVFSCLLLCNRDVLRSFFVISRVLYDNFKITKEKIDQTYVKNAIVNTGHAMKDTISRLDWGLKRIIDTFMDMGKDIKSKELK
jgi:hypothetical protein